MNYYSSRRIAPINILTESKAQPELCYRRELPACEVGRLGGVGRLGRLESAGLESMHHAFLA